MSTYGDQESASDTSEGYGSSGGESSAGQNYSSSAGQNYSSSAGQNYSAGGQTSAGQNYSSSAGQNYSAGGQASAGQNYSSSAGQNYSAGGQASAGQNYSSSAGQNYSAGGQTSAGQNYSSSAGQNYSAGGQTSAAQNYAPGTQTYSAGQTSPGGQQAAGAAVTGSPTGLTPNPDSASYHQGYADGEAGHIGKCLTDPQADADYQSGYQAGKNAGASYDGPTIGSDNRTDDQRNQDRFAYLLTLARQQALHVQLKQPPPGPMSEDEIREYSQLFKTINTDSFGTIPTPQALEDEYDPPHTHAEGEPGLPPGQTSGQVVE